MKLRSDEELIQMSEMAKGIVEQSNLLTVYCESVQYKVLVMLELQGEEKENARKEISEMSGAIKMYGNKIKRNTDYIL